MSVGILYPETALCHRAAQLRIHPKLLEDLLECLAKASFPINPELRHDTLRDVSYVEFPIADEQVAEIEDLLRASGFSVGILQIRPREVRIDREEKALAAEYERGL